MTPNGCLWLSLAGCGVSGGSVNCNRIKDNVDGPSFDHGINCIKKQGSAWSLAHFQLTQTGHVEHQSDEFEYKGLAMGSIRLLNLPNGPLWQSEALGEGIHGEGNDSEMRIGWHLQWGSFVEEEASRNGSIAKPWQWEAFGMGSFCEGTHCQALVL